MSDPIRQRLIFVHEHTPFDVSSLARDNSCGSCEAATGPGMFATPSSLVRPHAADNEAYESWSLLHADKTDSLPEPQAG